MIPFTVVIMTKNEASAIADCIAACKPLNQPIVVADTGSTDETVAIAKTYGATILQVNWEGYGKTRNTIAALCKTDWLLVIDADEQPTAELIKNILYLSASVLAANPSKVYGFKRRSYLGKKPIYFGEWGRDKVFRLYNKQYHRWDDALVHENIVANKAEKEMIGGELLHYTMQNVQQLINKQQHYAQLNAEKYFKAGKKAGFVKRFLAPVFNFVQNFFLRLGFLDGKEGFIIAKYNMFYVYWKYKALYSKYKHH
ncbi:MAG: glycosyltransferase family 2 protein [Chitinophagaceae bacterium]